MDCETHFRNAQVNYLLKAIQTNQPFERRLFFEQIIGCKRRNQKNWDRTPVSRVFTIEHEYSLLHLRTLALRMRALIRERGLLSYDAFTKFDFGNVGSLSCGNVLAGMTWLGLHPSHEDVMNFVSMASSRGDPRINFTEWVDIMASTSTLRPAASSAASGMEPFTMTKSSSAHSESFELDECATAGGDGATLPRCLSSIDEDSSAATAAEQGDERIAPIDEAVFDVLQAKRESDQLDQKRRQEESMRLEERRIRRAIRAHKHELQRARGIDDNPSARGDTLRFDFRTGFLPDDVTTVGYTFFEPTPDGQQQLHADPASMVVLPIGNYGMPWSDVVDVYTISMYVTVPRMSTEEEQRERRIAAHQQQRRQGHEQTAVNGEDDEDGDGVAGRDPDQVRQLMPHSLSDETHAFPLAGAPLLQLNRHVPDSPIIYVAADGRVGLSEELREDTTVSGTRVLWQWQSDQGWIDFDAEHIAVIEREFTRDPRSSATFHVFGIGVFVINFRTMCQRNQQNGASRTVRRHQRVDGNRVEADKPALITITVDVAKSLLVTYVNDIVSGEYRIHDPRRLAVDTTHQLFVFGHHDPQRIGGGKIQWLTFLNACVPAAVVAHMFEEVRVLTEWACDYCSFRNPDGRVSCTVCEMARQKKPAKDAPWTCACTNVNASTNATCSFCELPRGAKLS